MKRNTIFITVVLVSAFFVGAVSATTIQTEKDIAEKKGVTAAAKKNKDALRKAKKIQAGGVSTSTDASKASAKSSKDRHDTAEKVIDNLK